jgi:hypothetical protein
MPLNIVNAGVIEMAHRQTAETRSSATVILGVCLETAAGRLVTSAASPMFRMLLEYKRMFYWQQHTRNRPADQKNDWASKKKADDLNE